jgi:hypothetical protein
MPRPPRGSAGIRVRAERLALRSTQKGQSASTRTPGLSAIDGKRPSRRHEAERKARLSTPPRSASKSQGNNTRSQGVRARSPRRIIFQTQTGQRPDSTFRPSTQPREQFACHARRKSHSLRRLDGLASFIEACPPVSTGSPRRARARLGMSSQIAKPDPGNLPFELGSPSSGRGTSRTTNPPIVLGINE